MRWHSSTINSENSSGRRQDLRLRLAALPNDFALTLFTFESGGENIRCSPARNTLAWFCATIFHMRQHRYPIRGRRAPVRRSPGLLPAPVGRTITAGVRWRVWRGVDFLVRGGV
ncbi:hypothetical protein KCP78_10465 [Salmonella enterica subsp. enterica]|nr:hypothetical protein KCP78_10465 [Salmonella enterica subsp. enterica]